MLTRKGESHLKCFVLQDFMKMVLKCSAAFTLQRGQLCQLAGALCIILELFWGGA